MIKKIFIGLLALIFLSVITFGVYFILKYQKADTMVVDIEEMAPGEYPEDPSTRSTTYHQYGNRHLILIKKGPTTFDFIFESENPKVATVIFRDIDLSLYVPIVPEWAKVDPNLEVIALTDREWNRQQVRFDPSSEHLEIVGGDGFEKSYLESAELARNCLNAGLWEVMLYTKEHGQKTLYYQGWFTFPLGHYKDLFEELNNISYWKHWHRLEHWYDPVGTYTNLASLRTILDEKRVRCDRQPQEKVIVAGEQARKAGTFEGRNVECWGDFCSKNGISFASFISPGRYSTDHPWNHEYERIAHLEKTFIRRIRCPGNHQDLFEIEMVFRSSIDGKLNRLLVSGFDLTQLPQIPVNKYPEGLYMPMGIGIPPFYQTYEELKRNPPYKNPFFSLVLDENNRWINHHEVAIDGPVMHRDMNDPNLIHLYLLSYERHSLVGHFKVYLDQEILY